MNAHSNIPSLSRQARGLIDNIEKVIVGKRGVVTQAVTALLAEGHILLEDVPGIGKTVLARSLARSIEGDFKRVQFTPDLLPSDVTGVNTFDQATGRFTFRPGPVFCNVLLGDEINRATPRTQSSLLEAMEEYRVTVDGQPYPLEKPFMVIATQNPIEIEGTYPLPFAQMDRFIVRLRLGYLKPEEECRMLQSRMQADPLEALAPVMDRATLINLQAAARGIAVQKDLLDYIIAIVNATRDSKDLAFGASPRGSLDMTRYSQVSALLAGRDYVLPDDIKAAAPLVLTHRVIIKRATRQGTLNTGDHIKELVDSIAVPL
jgi:MoxR-like ATPase